MRNLIRNWKFAVVGLFVGVAGVVNGATVKVR